MRDRRRSTTVCGTSSGMKARCGGLAAPMSATSVRVAFAGKVPNALSSNLPRVSGSTSPDDRDPQAVLGQHRALRSPSGRRFRFLGTLSSVRWRGGHRGDRQRDPRGISGGEPRLGLVVSRRRPDNTWVRIRSTSVPSKLRRGQRHPQQIEGFIPCPSDAQGTAQIVRVDEKLSSMARRSRRSW